MWILMRTSLTSLPSQLMTMLPHSCHTVWRWVLHSSLHCLGHLFLALNLALLWPDYISNVIHCSFQIFTDFFFSQFLVGVTSACITISWFLCTTVIISDCNVRISLFAQYVISSEPGLSALFTWSCVFINLQPFLVAVMMQAWLPVTDIDDGANSRAHHDAVPHI